MIIIVLLTCQASPRFDEKNIRRRIYDALNVLLAMDIITKVYLAKNSLWSLSMYQDKKSIRWRGVSLLDEHESTGATPVSPPKTEDVFASSSVSEHVIRLQETQSRLSQKKSLLEDLTLQYVAMQNLTVAFVIPFVINQKSGAKSSSGSKIISRAILFSFDREPAE